MLRRFAAGDYLLLADPSVMPTRAARFTTERDWRASVHLYDALEYMDYGACEQRPVVALFQQVGSRKHIKPHGVPTRGGRWQPTATRGWAYRGPHVRLCACLQVPQISAALVGGYVGALRTIFQVGSHAGKHGACTHACVGVCARVSVHCCAVRLQLWRGGLGGNTQHKIQDITCHMICKTREATSAAADW